MNWLRRTRSGTWLVVAMIGFGLLLTAGMYTYATLHRAPFRALAVELAREYPGTAPRVEGGKLRLDQPGETTLRITMQSPFDPADEDRANSFARDVAAFVAARHDLAGYDIVEVHLFHRRSAEDFSQRSIRLSVEELAPPDFSPDS